VAIHRLFFKAIVYEHRQHKLRRIKTATFRHRTCSSVVGHFRFPRATSREFCCRVAMKSSGGWACMLRPPPRPRPEMRVQSSEALIAVSALCALNLQVTDHCYEIVVVETAGAFSMGQ